MELNTRLVITIRFKILRFPHNLLIVIRGRNMSLNNSLDDSETEII